VGPIKRKVYGFGSIGGKRNNSRRGGEKFLSLAQGKDQRESSKGEGDNSRKGGGA